MNKFRGTYPLELGYESEDTRFKIYIILNILQ